MAPEHAGILVDPQFGDAILRDAYKNGYITCLPAEKSGQAEFQFEYGAQYAAKIEEYQPTFVKTLVRYNPEEAETYLLRSPSGAKPTLVRRPKYPPLTQILQKKSYALRVCGCLRPSTGTA